MAALRRLNRFVACALVAGTVALAGCASRADASRDRNTIVSLTRTDGATMNPIAAQTVQDGTTYAQLLYDSLSYIGADYLPHPRLATDWSHSPDGLHWTVNLRHGVRWSDGQPFTSKDVVFTYDALIDPKTAAVQNGDLNYIKRVTADGPFRVHFDLRYPSAVFVLTAMGLEASILPEHVLGKIPHERLRTSDFGEHPVGTGPYILERWLHDSETVFVANPYTWRPPHIHRIDVRTIFDEQAVVQAMANGSADLDDDLSSVRYRQYVGRYPDLDVMTFDSVYIDVTVPNVQRPGLSDVNVRRAMMYGQDRVSLIAGFFGNKVPLPDNAIPTGLKHWHNADVQTYPYDPPKARAILDAAGWRPGPDGVRRKRKTRLAFEVLLNQGSPIYTATMLAFVADMKDIGIDVRLRILDFPSMITREYAGKFDMAAQGMGGSVDPDLTGNLGTVSIPPNGLNVGFYSDPTLDKLLKAGLIELDDAKRRVIYNAMQRRIADQVPIFYQYGRFSGLAHSKRLVLNPKTTLQSPLLYYNVDDWTVKP